MHRFGQCADSVEGLFDTIRSLDGTHSVLYENQLVGAIPQSIGSLVNLTQMYVNNHSTTIVDAP